MAELAYIAHGLRGSLYNTTELCRRLIERGHGVTVLSFRDVRADVEAVGATFRLLADGPRAAAEFDAEVARVGKRRAIRLGRTLRRRLIESTEVSDELARLAPELILIDAEMHGAIISTHRLATPRLTVLPFFSVHASMQTPPLSSTMRPPINLSDRARCGAEWASIWTKRWFDRSLRGFNPKGLRARLRPFQLNSPNIANVGALARHHGFDLRGATRWRQWLHPHIYDLPMLSFTSASLDFADAAPTEFHHVGPMINDYRCEPLVGADDRASWHAFLARSQAAGRPVIYASMGSLQPANSGYYTVILEVFRKRADWSVVIGMGNQGDIEVLRPVPDNALVLSYAPQLEVLAEASVAIHSGGAGTLHECVHASVRSVVCSTMVVDQPGNVARVDYYDLGTSIPIDDLTPNRLEIELEGQLARSSENFEDHHVAFARYKDEAVAVKVIESFLT